MQSQETEILDIFNQITGRRFRAIKSNLKGITARLKDGYTTQEIIEVIQVKALEWKNNPTMSVHLNPVTIFRPANFEKYINQVLTIKQNPKLYANHFKSINKIRNSAADRLDELEAMFGE